MSSLDADIATALCILRNRAVGIVTKEENEIPYSENFAFNDYQYSNCRIIVECDRAPPGYPSAIEIQAIGDEPNIHGLFDDLPLFSRRDQEDLFKVNFRLAKKWYSHCKSIHAGRCTPEVIEKGHQDRYQASFRAVDVEKMCITPADPSGEYAALSYVWGKAPMLMLLQENKSRLYQPGALSQDDLATPRTIRDAINVTSQLGIRYLWVDALCIMQDDKLEKGKVIGDMDLIYNRAALTIVAASGSHADAGLSGLTGDRETALYEPVSIPGVEEKKLVVARTTPSQLISRTKWNSRGWTYQERLCSRRMLVFSEEQLLYWCSKASWCEDTVLETDNEHVRYNETPLHRFNLSNDISIPFMKQVEESSSVTQFQEYALLVEEYTRRDLSFPGDVVDAFTGALLQFKKIHETAESPIEFYFGTPLSFLGLALRWQPQLNCSPHQRRAAKWRTQEGVEVSFPSWSWTGWIGNTRFEYPQTMEFMYRSEIHIFYVELTGKLARIPPLDHPPQPSWLQHSGKFLLREQWRSDDGPIEPTIDQVRSQNGQNLYGLLVFYSSTCFLPLIERNDGLVPKQNQIKSVTHYFISGDGQGWIEIDPAWISSHPAPKYEFVVLSRSLNSDWEDPGKKDSLTVMLIEWKESIAYRVGVGSVSESVWVNANPTWTLILLG